MSEDQMEEEMSDDLRQIIEIALGMIEIAKEPMGTPEQLEKTIPVAEKLEIWCKNRLAKITDINDKELIKTVVDMVADAMMIQRYHTADSLKSDRS